MTRPERLLIVGTGLIGTSVALAVRAAEPDVRVLLADLDTGAVRTAVARGAGEAHSGERADHVLLAVPPSYVGEAASTWARHASTLSDVSSVQSHVQADIETRGLATVWCGSHPMAGRERGGPEAAEPDLFRGRTWVLCPSDATSSTAQSAAAWLAATCGARTVLRTAAEHDAAVAVVSHLPQLVASSLAAALAEVPLARTELAGPGLLDTTRIAGSPPALWSDLVRANAEHVLPGLDAVLRRLHELRGAADAGPEALAAAVHAVVSEGNVGRARLPGKRGTRDDAYRWVAVVVEDRPGQLAGLFAAAAEGGVNVEDIRVDHTPGLPLGVVELAVAVDDAARAEEHLAATGWRVTGAGGRDAADH